ncbi:hypothetical protein CRENBAI_021439 [Crenichthys baileyi]|uniref:Uncharacterized protein n=1 Tax=Crenichthys baileyi TaxID=28760 RepID=A0AAV9RWP0_9TELE
MYNVISNVKTRYNSADLDVLSYFFMITKLTLRAQSFCYLVGKLCFSFVFSLQNFDVEEVSDSGSTVLLLAKWDGSFLTSLSFFLDALGTALQGLAVRFSAIVSLSDVLDENLFLPMVDFLKPLKLKSIIFSF